jgi:hypothetical protein
MFDRAQSRALSNRAMKFWVPHKKWRCFTSCEIIGSSRMALLIGIHSYSDVMAEAAYGTQRDVRYVYMAPGSETPTHQKIQ